MQEFYAHTKTKDGKLCEPDEWEPLFTEKCETLESALDDIAARVKTHSADPELANQVEIMVNEARIFRENNDGISIASIN